MTEFDVGDRVRVRLLPTSKPYAGRLGAVVWISYDEIDKRVFLAYRVRFDDMRAGYTTFSPHELELAPSATP